MSDIFDGRRLRIDLPADEHGKPGTYKNKGCRCQLCTVANNAAHRKRRTKGKRRVH